MSGTTWTVRPDQESVEWRRRLQERYPLAPPHRLLRLALRYGLRAAAIDPSLLLEEADPDRAPRNQ